MGYRWDRLADSTINGIFVILRDDREYLMISSLFAGRINTKMQ
jgi:hypothetical protein